MKIHLAQASSDRRLSELFKILLAEEHPINEKDMKIYLAGENGKKKILENHICDSEIKLGDLNILESFYYLKKDIDIIRLIPYFNSFLLDSGAFTFLQGNHNRKIDWDKYIEEYGTFINKYHIDLFFELDIDSIVGLAEVERLRNKLQRITGKYPIPVWHKNRGKDYFIEMCKKYPYVAIGGIVIKEIKREIYEKLFPWFIKIAHQNNTKIHGLGYTGINNLKYYHFDSVDSTAWLYGNRAGFLYKFNNNTGLIEKIKKTKEDRYRLKSKEGAINNFIQWCKFSKYAEKYF